MRSILGNIFRILDKKLELFLYDSKFFPRCKVMNQSINQSINQLVGVGHRKRGMNESFPGHPHTSNLIQIHQNSETCSVVTHREYLRLLDSHRSLARVSIDTSIAINPPTCQI